MKRAFVHAGTHKTGTTTLQIMLGSWDEGGGPAGLYAPRSGRYPTPGVAGHHNVAWELNDDPRFVPKDGTLTSLASEIAHCDASVVVVSSEDFEYLHTRPAALRRLANTLHDSGYEPAAILYLRSREEYAQSLYAELVKHGLACSVFDFIDRLRRDGSYTHATNWTFALRYAALAEAFSLAFGAQNLFVRTYHPNAANLELERDFVTLLVGESANVTLPDVGRANPSFTLLEVLNALHANLPAQRSVPDPHLLVDEILAEDERDVLGTKFAPLSELEVSRFREAFAADDELLRVRFGIAALEPSAHFSERTARLQERVMLAADERWGLRTKTTHPAQ